MKNFLQVNRALVAKKNITDVISASSVAKKHINLNFRSDANGRHGSINVMSLCNVSRFKHEDDTYSTRTRHELGLYLHRYVATLLVLLMAGFGNAWGQTTITIFDGTVDDAKASISTHYVSGTEYTDLTTGFKYTCVTVKNNLVSTSTYTKDASVSKTYTNALSQNGSTVNASNNHFKLVVPSGFTASVFVAYACTSSAPKYVGLHSAPQQPDGSNCTYWNATIASKNDTKFYGATISDLSAGTYYLMGNSGNNVFGEISVSLTAAASPRTFKSGQVIYFKDTWKAQGNASTWKISESSCQLCAKFDGDGTAWYNCTGSDNVSGSWNAENTIYKITVPGSGKEFTSVQFTRGTNTDGSSGEIWNSTTIESPAIGKNLFCVKNTTTDSKYQGWWDKYSPNPALIGDFNNWDPDANVFGDYDGNVGVTYFTLEETSHTYGFKILQGETYYSFDNSGSGWTLTATRTSEQQLYDNNKNSNITSTTEVGEYAMKYDKSTHKFKAIYYPDERLTKNTILYFDARRQTNWQTQAFHTKFYFKKYDSDSELPSSTYLFGETPVENWVYYVTVPNYEKVGKVQIMRMNPSDHADQWCYANMIHANTRSSGLQNCLTEEVGKESTCSPWTPGWQIYCPPTTSETFADNSTTKILWTSGNGTSGNPYLVKTGTDIKVQASASKAVNDANMTIHYDFKVNSSSEQEGTGSTYTHSAATNNTVYQMDLDVYTVYNLKDDENSTKHSQTAIYYKALNTYTVTHTVTHATSSDRTGTDAAAYYQPYTATFTPATGYNLPATITVKFGSTTKTSGSDYTWNSSTGVLSIPANKIDGNVTVIFDGEAQEYSITYLDEGGDEFSGYSIGTAPIIHTYGTATALKKAVKQGYVFGGWYTDSKCTSSAGESLGATAYTDDITLYAKWTAISMADLVSGTFYGASAMVPAGVTVGTEAYYPGVSTDQRFDNIGVGAAVSSSSASGAPMSSKGGLSSKSLINTSAVTECMYFKDQATVSSYIPTDHAIQFKIPAAGQLEVWANSGIYLSNGSSETTITPSSDYAVITGLSAGTYYLYAKNTSRTLWGIRYKKTHSVSAGTSTGTNTYGTVSAAASVLAEDSTTTITASPVTGYQVASWAKSGTGASISPEGSSSSTTTTLTMGTADATVTVTFGLINYSVTYSAPDNGDYTIKVGDGSATGATKTANYGNTITLAADPEEGYEFSEWTIVNTSTSADVTDDLLGDDADDAEASFTMPAENVTVTATFTATATYTVTYKANGGTGEDVEDDAATTVADNTFTAPATKAFVGWNTKANGSGKDYAAGDAVDDNLTLYAQWRYKVYYIASSTSESNDITTALASKYVVSVHETTSTSYNASDYSDYALIVLSESLTGKDAATTGHELKVIVGLNKPILNLKSYFYNSGRWGWGTPNAGKNSKGIYVKNDTYANLTSHPIYSGLTPNGSDSIVILSSTHKDKKPIQPIGSFESGKEGYTLAKVANNDSGSGTAIHELTAAQRSTITGQSISAKYLLISIYSGDLSHLTTDGKTLIKNAADYLITGSQWVPQYAITKSASHGSIATEVSSSAVTSAAAGTRVDITATADDDYDFDSWSIYKTGDAETTVSVNSPTTSPTYFTMPAYAVTVAATFVEECTKPGTPTRPTIEDGTLTHAGATFVWDPEGATAHSNGYVVSIVKVSDGSTVLDWTSSGIYTEGGAGGLYDATGLTGSTEYYFIVKAIGADGYCSYGDTSRLTFTTLGTPYTITYHLNGASWINEGAATYRHGTSYTLPVAGDMSNTGYTFGGWYANSDLSTGGVVTVIADDATGNKEFWAKWTENTYTITYNANGGTGTTSATEGHYVTVANNSFTAPSGKIFAGWNTNSGGSGSSYGEGDEIELTANMTLYAIWATDYDISWGSIQISGAGDAVTPNLGGKNYTITATISSWTGDVSDIELSDVTTGVTASITSTTSTPSKTVTITFAVGADVAGDGISMTLNVPAYSTYGAKSDKKDISIERCGGSASSTELFSNDFSTATAVAYVNDGSSTYSHSYNTSSTLSNLVGSGTNLFTSLASSIKKGNIAVNSSTGGNSVDATGFFQVYGNGDNTVYWSLNRTSDFAATAPTALQVSMDIWYKNISSGSEIGVQFAVGDGFSDGLASSSSQSSSKVHSGFGIYANSTASLHAYENKKTTLYSTGITQSTWLSFIWIINNTGSDLTYSNPTGSGTTILANDKFDLWVKTQAGLASTYTKVINAAAATTASKDLQNLYIGNNPSSGIKKHEFRLDNVVVTDISPTGGKVTPTLTWDDGALDIASDGVTKDEGDADFTYTASQNKNSLGAITYESSNTSVATVNETTGKVHIVGDGKAIITATIAESGCYEDASVTYTLTVNEEACSDAAGTIKNNDGSTITDNAITKSSCKTVTLKLVGYTDDADIQWYKDGEEIDGADEATYTVSDAGVYSAISSTTNCDRNSTNEITVTNNSSVSATKIVDNWYVKADRRTPDIALVQTTDAASFQVKISSTVIWSTVSGNEVTTGLGGCGFYLGKDGIIYLKGTKNNGNATDDITSDQTLSFVVTNACGTNASDPGNITIKRQASTSRPSVAYVSVGTANGAVTDTTAGYYKTTALYKYLDNTLGGGNFDLTAQNAYWSVSEKELKEHYSQFDAILITDDPSTDKKNKKGGTSFIDAIGSLVDVRPILTMEAYVSKLSNWKAKGIDGNPSSPNPRQYGMTLQCKDHEIFGDLDVGDNVKEKTIDGTTYWTVLMVDSTKSPYSGVAYNSETKEKPALQGFAASDVSGLLLLGEISNGTLYAGVERQEEPAARLMVLGINAKALPNALTNEGKIIIKNSLGYLLKTNMEEVDDCSNYFTGKTSSDWNTESNWSKGVVPNSPMIRARIMKPCEITGLTVKAAQIDIVTSGTSSKIDGTPTGKLTINPTGALIVGGKIRAAEAPYFSIEDLKPTEETDLVINTNSSAQAALVFNNDKGDTKATVNLYSLGRKESGTYQFQYMAVPMDYVSVSESFAGSGIYTYVWNEASGWERRGYYTDLFAFEGVGITTKFGAAKDYTMKGTLASTETKEIALTNDADGINMIGNSWTAPIQISKLEEDNSATEINQTVYIYCTGNGNTVIDGTTETPGQWLAIPFSAASFGEWDGLKVIPAMQAFDIKVSGTSTLTLDYDKLVRGGTTDMNAKLRAPKRNVAHEGIDLTRIRVADSKTHTDLYLFEGDQFSDEFDNGWEAEFMSGDGRSAQLYAQTELGKMAVIALPEIEGTVLGFVPGQESVYTFHFTGANNGYYLNDLKLLQSTPIDETSTYTFTYEEGDTNRFIISSTPINKIVTGNENVGAEAAKVRKLILNDKVYIIRSGRMYSVDGQMVK